MEFTSRKREVKSIKWSEKRHDVEAPVERERTNTIQERKREVVT